MHSVVADTSPIFYLLTIGQTDLLQQLFVQVFVPAAVHQELCHPAAPASVRNWAGNPPSWVLVKNTPAVDDPVLRSLDTGERSAIALALSLPAELVLMDDRKGAVAALRKGLKVTGTLGILCRGAHRGLIDLGDCFARLKETNFRYRPEILDALLDQQGGNV